MGILGKYFAPKPERRQLSYAIYLVRASEHSNRPPESLLSCASAEVIRGLGHTIQAQRIAEKIMVWCANEEVRYQQAATVLAKVFGTDSVAIASHRVVDALSSGSAASTGRYSAPTYFGNQLRMAAENEGITTHIVVVDGSTAQQILALVAPITGRAHSTLHVGEATSYLVKGRSPYRGAALEVVR